ATRYSVWTCAATRAWPFGNFHGPRATPAFLLRTRSPELLLNSNQSSGPGMYDTITRNTCMFEYLYKFWHGHHKCVTPSCALPRSVPTLLRLPLEGQLERTGSSLLSALSEARGV